MEDAQVDHLNLPNSDSPEVMEQAVSIWMTSQIWQQVARVVHHDDAEDKILSIYDKVYRAVKKTHREA